MVAKQSRASEGGHAWHLEMRFMSDAGCMQQVAGRLWYTMRSLLEDEPAAGKYQMQTQTDKVELNGDGKRDCLLPPKICGRQENHVHKSLWLGQKDGLQARGVVFLVLPPCLCADIRGKPFVLP